MRELTIIIPYYNGKAYIQNLLNTIPNNIPIIIIDDLSDEPLKIKHPNTTVYRLKEKGYFTGACNWGIQQCDTDVLILNQDTVLEDGWQTVINHEYALIGESIKGKHPLFPNQYIHGVFMWIRRDLIHAIGLMNQELYPLWGSTAEYQLRASRAGFKVLPLKEIPGLKHFRPETEQYGSSIKQFVAKNPQDKAKLIRTPPIVSIVIPCYNYAHYLQDAINSLIGGQTCLGKLPPQSFQSFEIIIVDDGSNEENQKIIQSYIDGWNGIRAIRLERKPLDKNGKYIGKPSALNYGISKAIGKYITVLDADDMMDSRRLQALHTHIEQNPNSIIYDQIISFKQHDKKVKWHNERSDKNIDIYDTNSLSLEQETTLLTKYACQNLNKTIYGNRLAFFYWPLPDYNFDTLLDKNCMHAGIMFSKKAWQDIGGYNEHMAYGREDWAINVAFGEKGYCGLKIQHPYYLYRREGQNRTLENTKPTWQSKFKQQMYDLYPNLYRGERTMACCGQGSSKTKQLNGGGNKTLKLSQQKDGLTYVKYEGNRSASFSIWGPVTGVQYRVNPNNPVFLVDDNDLYTNGRMTGILDVYEGTKHAFNTYSKPEPVKIKTVAVTELEPAIQDTFEEKETFEEFLVSDNESEPVLTERHFEVLSTVSKLHDFLVNQTFSLQELEAMLEYELANGNRITAIKDLEKVIDSYDGTAAVEPFSVSVS